jgi:hypothetical protein
MHFCALLVILLVSQTPSWGADSDAFPDIEKNDAVALQEASRVLGEELKLAARSQAYLLIDLVAYTIEIKARGVTLHPIPVTEWSASAIEQMTGAFRLDARPLLVRRKIEPSLTAEQEPIALTDMPTQYVLSFTPALSVEIAPIAREGLSRWAWWYGVRWWRHLERWTGSFVLGQPTQFEPSLRLSLSVEQAQSLAWSLVDGMGLVIRRPADK